MIKLPDDPSTQRSVATTLIISGVVLMLVRMALVLFWSVIGGNPVASNIWIEIALALMSDLVLACIVGVSVIYFGRRANNEMSYETIAGAITTYAVSALALLLVAALLPPDIEAGRPIGVVDLIMSNVIALGTFTVSIGFAGFLTQVLLARRHAKTRMLLLVQFFLLLCIWLCEALDSYSSFFGIMGFLLTVVGAIVMLINIRRLNWVAGITMDKKIRLLWLTACGAFAALILSLTHSFGEEAAVTESAQLFIRSGAVLPYTINFFGFVFFVRLLFAIVASLPNSGIVDRRSNEVESLAYLTRLMAETADVEQLLTSVTQFALRVCRAHGAWCETYEDDGEVRVIAAQLVHPDYVRALHSNRQLHRLLQTSERPVLIESVADHLPEADRSLAVRSLIAVPLVSNHHRTGTLVMFSTVEFGFEADDLRLLTAFGDTISIALDQARLMEAAIEKERLQKEFDVAQRIQSSLLPVTAPSIDRFAVDAITIPATEVGGDYFDYVRFANGSTGVLIADVSGKGIPAALYMATLKGAVLAEMRYATGPADLLRRINAALFGSMERQMYITMACISYHPDSRSLRVARAGHTPVLVRTGDDVHVLTPRGVAIGIVGPGMFDAALVEEALTVSDGDICLLTTDGVNERRNERLAEISLDPVVELIRAQCDTTASDIVRATLELLEQHADGAEQHDDLTIVAIRFGGASETRTHQERIDVATGVSA